MSVRLIKSRGMRLPKVSEADLEDLLGQLPPEEVKGGRIKDLFRVKGNGSLELSFCILEEGGPLVDGMLHEEMKKIGVRASTLLEAVSVRKLTSAQLVSVASELGHGNKMYRCGVIPCQMSTIVFVPMGTIFSNGQKEFHIICPKDKNHGCLGPALFERKTDQPLPPLWVFPVVEIN